MRHFRDLEAAAFKNPKENFSKSVSTLVQLVAYYQLLVLV